MSEGHLTHGALPSPVRRLATEADIAAAIRRALAPRELPEARSPPNNAGIEPASPGSAASLPEAACIATPARMGPPVVAETPPKRPRTDAGPNGAPTVAMISAPYGASGARGHAHPGSASS